ncbi:uncharacterized protein [Heterodontus francisci]|uniref:uncharacterized protein isoform X2 n=1 Tax=Heterodontus francisci TaxID=7792 RepID=UPI00355B780A
MQLPLKIQVLIRELLFAGNAALTPHTEEYLQRRTDRVAAACNEFGISISLKKTNIMGLDVRNAPSINIGDYALKVVQEFTYLGSTITSNLSLDAEINKRMGKASAAMSRLAKRVWENGALTWNTEVTVESLISQEHHNDDEVKRKRIVENWKHCFQTTANNHV